MVFKPKLIFVAFIVLAASFITTGCGCEKDWEPNIPINYNHASFTFISLSTGGYLLFDGANAPYHLEDLRIWNVETGRTIQTHHGQENDAQIFCELDTIPNNKGKLTSTYGIQLGNLPYREYQLTLHIYEPDCGETGFYSEALLDGERASAGGTRLIFD